MQDKILHSGEIKDKDIGLDLFLNTLSENEREFSKQYILLIRQGASNDDLDALAIKHSYSTH